MRDSKELCHLSSNLSGVSVHGLLPADDQIVVPDVSDGSRKYPCCSIGVRASELPVSQKDHLVCTLGESHSQRSLRSGRSHGHCRYLHVIISALKVHSRLESVFIEGINLRICSGTVDDPLLTVELYGRHIGYFFYQYQYLHKSSL